MLTTVDECCDFTCGGYTCNDGWVPDALKAYEFARLPWKLCHRHSPTLVPWLYKAKKFGKTDQVGLPGLENRVAYGGAYWTKMATLDLTCEPHGSLGSSMKREAVSSDLVNLILLLLLLCHSFAYIRYSWYFVGFSTVLDSGLLHDGIAIAVPGLLHKDVCQIWLQRGLGQEWCRCFLCPLLRTWTWWRNRNFYLCLTLRHIERFETAGIWMSPNGGLGWLTKNNIISRNWSAGVSSKKVWSHSQERDRDEIIYVWIFMYIICIYIYYRGWWNNVKYFSSTRRWRILITMLEDTQCICYLFNLDEAQ